MAASYPQGTLLAALRPSSLRELLSLGTHRQYAAGTAMVRQGEPPGDVMILLDGYTKVTAVNVEGEQAFLTIRSRGDLIGEIAVLDGCPRTATVTAAGAVTARTISGATFRAFLDRDSVASVAVTRSVTDKFRRVVRQRLEHTGSSVRARLARVLVELAARWGMEHPDGVLIAVGLSQAELASLVGAVERSVHEALSEFRNQGLISVGYRRIIVSDPIALLAV